MVSLFTEFHYALKDVPKFDIGKEGFSVKQIYDHYSMKVRCSGSPVVAWKVDNPPAER